MARRVRGIVGVVDRLNLVVVAGGDVERGCRDDGNEVHSPKKTKKKASFLPKTTKFVMQFGQDNQLPKLLYLAARGLDECLHCLL